VASTSDYGERSFSSPSVSTSGPAGGGWVAFAGFLLGLAGIWNVIEGILAISESRVFVGEQVFVFSDLNTWGWIILALGVLQLTAAFTVVAGNEFGRWIGIGAAGANAIGQLLFVPAFPLWAMSMFALDILIIYALAVYGGSRLRGAAI
jgi:hypothetical protein